MTLLEWRRQSGRTIVSIAGELRISPRTWSRWERGRVFPPGRKWRAIERVTNGAVTAAQLSDEWLRLIGEEP